MIEILHNRFLVSQGLSYVVSDVHREKMRSEVINRGLVVEFVRIQQEEVFPSD
jgi:hypothetical protein